MARYFFDLYECGTHLPDEEGAELASVDMALDKALNEARTVMASEVIAGRLCLSCYITVEDEERHEVGRVLFKDALTVSGL